MSQDQGKLDAFFKQFPKDSEFTQKLIAKFLQESPKYIEGLKVAVRDGDQKNVIYWAHSLKGAVGHFGEKDVHEKAYELELLGESGSLEDASAVFEELEILLRVFNECLAQVQKKAC